MKLRVPSEVLEGLLYALTAFGVFAFGGVEPWSRAVVEILAFLLALACFLKGRPAGSPAGAYFWLFPAAVAVLGGLQLLAPAAPAGPRPLAAFTAAPHETQASVMLWASYAAVLWSVPRIIGTPEAARRYARFLFGLGAALAALGLLQAATGGDTIYWLRYAPRTSSFGPYYNRNHAANILLMSLAAGIGILCSRLRSPDSRLSSQGPLAGGLLVVLLGLAACASQAAFLAVPLAGAAAAFIGADFARSPRRRRARAAAAVAGAVMTVYFAYRHVAANADAGALLDSSVRARLSIYADTWRWWRDSPLFGTGLGSFETVYPSYQDLGLLGTVAHAHSDWIEFTLEAGLFGLAAALLAAALAAFCAARSWREARSDEMRALIGGGLAAAAAFAAHALFEFSFQIPGNAVVFFGLLGFLLSAPSWADKSPGRVKRQTLSTGAVLLAAGYFLVLARAALPPAPDELPLSLYRSAAAAYKGSGVGVASNPVLLRASLDSALAAVELRPFDSAALYLAGAGLWRLGRQADNRVFLERARLVRFARIEPVRLSAEQRRERKIEILRSLNLVPRRLEKR